MLYNTPRPQIPTIADPCCDTPATIFHAKKIGHQTSTMIFIARQFYIFLAREARRTLGSFRNLPPQRFRVGCVSPACSSAVIVFALFTLGGIALRTTSTPPIQ